MPDYARMQESLTSPEGFLALSDESGVFGARKAATAAQGIWETADERWVGAYDGVRVPGGTGTGFVARLFWNPAATTVDMGALRLAAAASLPVDLIKADAKATWKGRDKKQGLFFAWRGAVDRPLSQWFRERFGVSAFITQLFDPSDLSQDVGVVAVKDGIEHLWTLSAK